MRPKQLKENIDTIAPSFKATKNVQWKLTNKNN